MMSILNINLWFQIWNICNEITPKIANNFNVSKSVILLLMLLDNHSLILDIISLYAYKTSEDVCKKLEDEKCNHDNLEANLLMLDSFLDKISNFK